jgi:hypothetical protein
VDVVVAAAIDPAEPKVAQVHLFDAKELPERFDRARRFRHGRTPTASAGAHRHRLFFPFIGMLCNSRTLSDAALGQLRQLFVGDFLFIERSDLTVTRMCQCVAMTKPRGLDRDGMRRDAVDQAEVPTETPPVLLELEFWTRVVEAPTSDVSTWGRVRQGDSLIESWPNNKGYHLVSLEIAGRNHLRSVHRLVLMAFVGPGPGRLANHDDGRKGNNRLRNLTWTTPSGNMQHAWATGLMPRTRVPRATCRYGHPRTRSQAPPMATRRACTVRAADARRTGGAGPRSPAWSCCRSC